MSGCKPRQRHFGIRIGLYLLSISFPGVAVGFQLVEDNKNITVLYVVYILIISFCDSSDLLESSDYLYFS